MAAHRKFWKNSRKVYRFLIVVCSLAIIGALVVFVKEDATDYGYTETWEDNPDRIENGIHVRTGLVEAPGLMETVNNCTTCHSAKLIIQNRMGPERWHATIRWMQETQNLWDLGANEEIIVNYLVANYPPPKKGRRSVLTNIDWYELKEE